MYKHLNFHSVIRIHLYQVPALSDLLKKNVHLYLEVYKKEMYLCYIQAIFKKLQISDLLGALTLSLKSTKVRNFFVQ